MNVVRVIVTTKTLHDPKVFEQNKKTYGRQNAAIYNGGDFPVPFNLNVEQGHEYEPGEYTIAPQSYRVDEMGNLKLKSTKLLPLGGSSAPARKP